MPVHVLNLARTNTDNLGFANSQLGEVDGHLAANLVDENTAATVVEQSNLLTDSTDLNIRQAAEGGPIVAAQTTKKYSTELINSEPQRAAIIDKFAYTTGLAHTSLYYLTDQGSTHHRQ